MNLLDYVTEQEKSAFWYGANHYSESGCEVDANYLLREWARAKEPLFAAFNENLILEKEVEYKESFDELEERMWKARVNMPEAAKHFADHWSEFIYWLKSQLPLEMTFNIHYLSDVPCFANMARNSLHSVDEEIRVNIPKGNGEYKEYIVKNGMRPMRVINRLIDAYPNEYVTKEEANAYSQWCSQFLTARTLRGTLCLSIHPLDYMTMSDNSYDWNSCMSWEDNGCYRQGTVEMMNSSVVVVAYLAGDRPFHLNCTYDETIPWSNKKWRELFIVDETMICGIKGYPYQSEGLVKVTLEWLNEIMGGKYSKPQIMYHYRSDREYYNQCETAYGNVDFIPNFYTRNMYNDMWSTTHYFCYNVKQMEDLAKAGEKQLFYSLNYSGLPECMTCGELEPYFGSEQYLSCEKCYDDREYDYCTECGCEWPADEMSWVDDAYYCPECMDNPDVIRYDMISEEPHVASDFINVRIIGANGKIKIGEMWIYGIDDYFERSESTRDEDGNEVCDLYISEARDVHWVRFRLYNIFGGAFCGFDRDRV